jgi:predicted permease
MASVMRVVPLAPDARVFAFVLLAAVASALLFGLAPALQATRPSIVQASRGDFDTAFRPGRARAALVVAQITVCSLLLIVMGILLRGASDVTRIDPGIRTEGVVQLVLDDRSRAATLPRLHDRPDVRGVGASSWAVLDGIYPTVAVRPADSAITVAYFSFVDSGFFGVLDIPIRRGRSFTSGEAEAQAPVVVVSEAAAARLWPGRDPLGQLLRLAAEPPARSRLAAVRTARVIGVAGNVSSGWIGISRASPAVYYPGSAASANMRIVARVTGPGARERIDRALSLADPGAVVEIRAMADYIQLQTWPFRAIAWVATALGVIALVLTVIGIHGVLSYLIAQRTKEIGIRMALGAGVNSVVGLVVRQCARHALIGIGAGALLAVVVSRLFGSFLEIVDALDPRAYALGIAIVLAGAVIAAWSPARRAARVNPVDALRAD